MIRFLSIVAFFLTILPVVKSQIITDFKLDSAIHCTGNAVQFTDLSEGINGQIVTDWLWDFGDAATSADQNPAHAYSAAGTYQVKLTASNASWNASKTKSVTVRNWPEADFTYSGASEKPFYMIIFYGTVINADANTYHYSWNFSGDSLLFKDKDTAFYVFPGEGQHQVSFIVEAGLNCTDTATYTIEVRDSLQIPNVFSPNGDGLNDIFEFRTNGVSVYELTIYNRWGAVIYTITSKRPFWDGFSAAGVKMPSGSYYFNLKSADGSGYEKAGVVVLR
jgi:gliding motility-associated-like protein